MESLSLEEENIIKECVMHSKSDNMEIIINDEADEVIKELFFFTKK